MKRQQLVRVPEDVYMQAFTLQTQYFMKKRKKKPLWNFINTNNKDEEFRMKL